MLPQQLRRRLVSYVERVIVAAATALAEEQQQLVAALDDAVAVAVELERANVAVQAVALHRRHVVLAQRAPCGAAARSECTTTSSSPVAGSIACRKPSFVACKTTPTGAVAVPR
jgi:hypothetical protein